jgi:hypothetical protein
MIDDTDSDKTKSPDEREADRFSSQMFNKALQK